MSNLQGRRLGQVTCNVFATSVAFSQLELRDCLIWIKQILFTSTEKPNALDPSVASEKISHKMTRNKIKVSPSSSVYILRMNSK